MSRKDEVARFLLQTKTLHYSFLGGFGVLNDGRRWEEVKKDRIRFSRFLLLIYISKSIHAFRKEDKICKWPVPKVCLHFIPVARLEIKGLLSLLHNEKEGIPYVKVMVPLIHSSSSSSSKERNLSWKVFILNALVRHVHVAPFLIIHHPIPKKKENVQIP